MAELHSLVEGCLARICLRWHLLTPIDYWHRHTPNRGQKLASCIAPGCLHGDEGKPETTDWLKPGMRNEPKRHLSIGFICHEPRFQDPRQFKPWELEPLINLFKVHEAKICDSQSVDNCRFVIVCYHFIVCFVIEYPYYCCCCLFHQ